MDDLGLDFSQPLPQAGRGPWAGPVVAAAVVSSSSTALLSSSNSMLLGVTDSKKLNEARDAKFKGKMDKWIKVCLKIVYP